MQYKSWFQKGPLFKLIMSGEVIVRSIFDARTILVKDICFTERKNFKLGILMREISNSARLILSYDEIFATKSLLANI